MDSSLNGHAKTQTIARRRFCKFTQELKPLYAAISHMRVKKGSRHTAARIGAGLVCAKKERAILPGQEVQRDAP